MERFKWWIKLGAISLYAIALLFLLVYFLFNVILLLKSGDLTTFQNTLLIGILLSMGAKVNLNNK